MAALAADALAPTKTYAYRLSNKDIAELADAVCDARHGVKHDNINAWSDKPKDVKNVQATVSCQPHATTEHYAVYYRADCRREEKWACKPSETRLHTTLNSRQIDIVTNGYKPEIAYSLVSKIAAHRNFKGEWVFERNTRECALSKGPSKELLDVTCDGKLFRLSYWCPQSSCPRIFSINGYFVPADSGGL